MSAALQPGIVVDDVWKRYSRRQRHDSLRDLLPSLMRTLLPGQGPAGLLPDEFWAVRDLSFAVEPGKVLGIIGPNGAGKSTILKLLTGIIRPTRGVVDVRGRIGALLEVTAGFHGDLTGRENVFLQGAIMGLGAREMARRFDAIVDFAGIEEFIDTPVKRYSSGMGARLGFAIAVHLDPEVLLVDEVLSVGDLRFQRKAFERLRHLVRQDIPVVVVSHQLDRMITLCDHAILLSHGTVIRAGSAAECVSAYIEGQHLVPTDSAADQPLIAIDSLTVPQPASVAPGERTRVIISGVIRDRSDLLIGLWIRNTADDKIVAAVHTASCGVVLPEAGPFALEVDLEVNLPVGLYRLHPFVWDRTARREQARGPSTMLLVESDQPTFGRVYLNPRMRLSRP